MPNCFQLFRKGEKEPAILQKVDDELRVAFEQPPDPENWLGGWYNYIGLCLAVGNSFEEIIADFDQRVANDPTDYWAKDMADIARWLNEHYTSDAWYEH